MKTLFLLFFFIIFLNNVKGELLLAQNNLAKSMILKYFSLVTTDPCSTPQFTCTADYYNPSIQYVNTISFVKYGSTKTLISEDLSIFKNASQIKIGPGFIVNDQFYFSLIYFNRLYQVDIWEQSSTIPTNVLFNDTSLNILNYGGMVHNGFFTSGLNSLSISTALLGYSIIGSFPTNSLLYNLELPITPTNGLPLGGNLLGLQLLKIIVQGDPGTNLALPNNFNQFLNLESLYISFISGNHVFQLPSSIKQIQKLKSLYISGDYILPPSNGVHDFNLNGKPIFLSFYYLTNFFSTCTQRPCIKVSKDSRISLYKTSVSLDVLDFSNYTGGIYITNHIQSPRNLPIDTINFNEVKYIDFSSSNFVGPIPEEFCKIKPSNLNLGGNAFTNVPSCMRCAGGSIYNIFPNSFVDFNTNSMPTCPTFSINPNYNKIAFTDKETIITIKGKDLGYDIKNNTIVPFAKITIPNNEFTITIPRGVGKDITFTYYFQNTLSIPFNFIFSYEKPVVSSFRIDSFGTLYIFASGLSYVSNMNLIINSVSTVVPKTIYGYVSTYVSPTLNTFTFNIEVGGQLSEQFTYIKEYSTTVNLFTSGGSKTIIIPGGLPTNDYSQIGILIDNQVANVFSISGSSIEIGYPQVFNGAGLYPLTLKISGVNYLNTQIKYIDPPIVEISYFIVESNTITVYGPNFGLSSSLYKIILNNIEYPITQVNSGSVSFTSSIVSSLTSFSLFIKQDGLLSNIQTFTKENIYILSITGQINTNGGTKDISGYFGESFNVNTFTVLVDGIICDFTQLTKLTVKINYPPRPSGFSTLTIINGGNKATSQFIYNYSGPPIQEF
ncbi:hypothetical protein RB653_001915 [Dictyostelium firmibasis]|uniref:IPT/TIG domain-containing protein n=1 Tax=Dictyostelium firmibasis TaxID=79012 RepID=A0AAN7U6Q0_9MYCE